jgi:hypothetical protein
MCAVASGCSWAPGPASVRVWVLRQGARHPTAPPPDLGSARRPFVLATLFMSSSEARVQPSRAEAGPRPASRTPVNDAYAPVGHNQTRAAEILGITPKTLYNKLRQYRLEKHPHLPPPSPEQNPG